MPRNGHDPRAAPADILRDWVGQVMADTDAFFAAPPTDDYILTESADDQGLLTFPSVLETRHRENTRFIVATFRPGQSLATPPSLEDLGQREAPAERPCSSFRSGTRISAATSVCAVCCRGTG